MSQKRMFDKSLLETDAFLDMPMPTKALYFLLGMEADDEGFVSPKRVIRLYGGNEDDIKILVAKGFAIYFDTGVLVITDWNKNNWLDQRRIKETIYQAEKKLLTLKSNKYALLSAGLADDKQAQSQYSIEESRVEYNIDQKINIKFDEFWDLYDKKIGRPKCEKKWNSLKDQERTAIMAYLPAYKASTSDKQFRKHPYTFLNQRGWEDEILTPQGKSAGTVKLHDGSSAVMWGGVWVDAKDKNVKIDLHYYPELLKL